MGWDPTLPDYIKNIHHANSLQPGRVGWAPLPASTDDHLVTLSYNFIDSTGICEKCTKKCSQKSCPHSIMNVF